LPWSLSQEASTIDTAEFHTYIRDGHIEVPHELRDRFPDSFKVTVIAERSSEVKGRTLIDDLLASPLKLPGFRPLTRDEAHGQ
jgi:hypothetical protein